jgi:hypothetical protein
VALRRRLIASGRAEPSQGPVLGQKSRSKMRRPRRVEAGHWIGAAGIREGIATRRRAATARGRSVRLTFSSWRTGPSRGSLRASSKRPLKGRALLLDVSRSIFAPGISTPPPGRQGPSARQGGGAWVPLRGVIGEQAAIDLARGPAMGTQCGTQANDKGHEISRLG